MADEILPATELSVRESFIYAQLDVRGRRTDEIGTALTVGLHKNFDAWLAAHDAEIRRDQAEKDAMIAESRYFGGGTVGAANRWGAKQAAVAIRAQFTPSPEERPSAASVTCTVGGCGTTQGLPDDGAGRIPLAPIEGWFYSVESGWLCPKHAPSPETEQENTR